MDSGPKNGDELADDPVDDRSPMAKAMDLASQVTSLSLMLAIPAGGGYLLDLWWNTGVIFTIAGALLGITASGWQLYMLVQRLERR